MSNKVQTKIKLLFSSILTRNVLKLSTRIESTTVDSKSQIKRQICERLVSTMRTYNCKSNIGREQVCVPCLHCTLVANSLWNPFTIGIMIEFGFVTVVFDFCIRNEVKVGNKSSDNAMSNQ